MRRAVSVAAPQPGARSFGRAVESLSFSVALRRPAYRPLPLLAFGRAVRATFRAALLSGVRCVVALTCAALLACGGAPARDDLPGEGPRFVTEGSCSPSTRSVELPLVSHETRCLRPLSRPRLVDTAADYLAAFEPGCTAPELDLQQQRVLIIPARGAAEWFVFPHFVHQRTDAVEVGLISRPQGALPPDQLLVLDREGPPLELRWCRSVCVSGCDAPLP